ncbi:hypothetical protein CORC01_12649 [Colletotrichum orchidophilum]|uniref:Uncharacterized protein n=1 Tax=Colletotrichum orchidophilum TaxID=1209926 RepID=A0A1G4ASC9_9PEZI|nr:uncharacterized protein CORC01_12649 [Colletotrichum orchidophilum]OHE92068.1 hypothetical protein CORC01_12649 [Colletotrichum orchidophilum]
MGLDFVPLVLEPLLIEYRSEGCVVAATCNRQESGSSFPGGHYLYIDTSAARTPQACEVLETAGNTATATFDRG